MEMLAACDAMADDTALAKDVALKSKGGSVAVALTELSMFLSSCS